MFNPEDYTPQKLTFPIPKKPSFKASSSHVQPPTNHSLGTIVQSDEDTLHTYLDMSEHCRRVHGFSRRQGKFYLVDKQLVDKMEPIQREMLRSWVRKKQKENSWGGVMELG